MSDPNNNNDLNIDDLANLIENPTQAKIYDININALNDLIKMIILNNYDFLVITPNPDGAEISFKKDGVSKASHNVKHNIYNMLCLSAKNAVKLDLSKTNIEQKAKLNYSLDGQELELIIKAEPGSLGETIFLKVKKIDMTNQVVENKKTKKISAGQAFSYLGAILFIVLIFGGAFLTFVVMNAQTPQDVSFFTNLGINLNDVNSFLQKLSTGIFSIFLLLETILGVIFLFKALTTKKEFRKKRTTSFIIATICLILMFFTGTMWLAIDKKIKALPNWQEMSYGDIQLYDNTLLTSGSFDKESSLIHDYSNIIGPIDIKFDLKYLKQEQLKKGFNVKKFVWDFGDGKKVETQNAEIVQTFLEKGNYNIKLELVGEDSRMPGKTTTKEAGDIPQIELTHVVKVTSQKIANGGMTYKFDATDLKQLGKIEWYLDSDIKNPAYVGEMFQPSKVYFKQDLIGMKINDGTQKQTMDKLFVLAGESSKITGDIDVKATLNDFEYVLTPKDITNTFGEGFISSFNWIIEDSKISKTADLTNIETSGQITFKFKEYGKHIIKLQIINSNGKSTEISKEVNIQKQLKLDNKISFSLNGKSLTDTRYLSETNEYDLYNIGYPSKLTLDAKNIRSNNPLYALKDISWSFGKGTDAITKSGEIVDFDLISTGFTEIYVDFKFVHRKDETDIIDVNQTINLQIVQQESNLDLQIKADSDYAPALVSFDASLSKVKNDEIIKFIYDYGDGVSEERDAVNPGHRYLKEGIYSPKLTVVTKSGKTYSITKSLVLKPKSDKANISVSLKEAPVGQEIDFTSSGSEGEIQGYFWDFGDGSTSTEANPSHAYKTAGTYKVSLTLDYVNNNQLSTNMNMKITE